MLLTSLSRLHKISTFLQNIIVSEYRFKDLYLGMNVSSNYITFNEAVDDEFKNCWSFLSQMKRGLKNRQEDRQKFGDEKFPSTVKRKLRSVRRGAHNNARHTTICGLRGDKSAVQNTSEKNSGKASAGAQRHSFSYRGRFCETRNVRRMNLSSGEGKEREKKGRKGAGGD